MKKVRVYQLAKELNTTSKRMIEKLKEIDIPIKNHMSFLNEEQLNALYDHIGVIRHDDTKKTDSGDSVTSKAPPKTGGKTKTRKESKDIPRIIRKTVIDTKSELKEEADRNTGKKKGAGQKKKKKRNFVKVSDNSTGLRPGLMRNSGFDYMDDLLNARKAEREKENKLKQQSQEQEEKKRAEKKTAGKKPEEKKQAEKKTAGKKPEEKKRAEKKTAGKKPEKRKHAEKKRVKKKESKETIDKKAVKSQTKKTDDNKKHMRTDSKIKQQSKKSLAGERQEGLKNKSEKEEKKVEKPVKSAGRNKSGRVESGKKHSSSAKPGFINQMQEKPAPVKQNKSKKQSAQTKKRGKITPKPGERKNKYNSRNIIVGDKRKVSEILSEDDYILDQLYNQKRGGRKKPPKPGKENKRKKHIPPKAVLTSIKIPETITVKNLAESLKKSTSEVIKKLMGLGMMATINDQLEYETASIVADEFGIKAEKKIVVNEEDILFDESKDDEKDLKPRPPVVVVMGHVDHGKTSVLDAIRETNVMDTEAGGITQHIGAYMVKVNERTITFLDTPGHEAFTSMRARGAQVTDIAILVIGADDGIMPQTVEAINHAKAAGVEIVVAINKIDKPGADPERIKQQLTEYELLPEEWGGDTICVNISAKERTNIDQLLEMVILNSDLLELKANPDRQAKGTVIESKLDKTRGTIATVLVQKGTLRNGDTIIAGTTVGRIRAMTSDKGQKVEEAGPSTPVEILGFDKVPEAGEVFYSVADEKLAKQLVEKRKQKYREDNLKTSTKVTLEDLFSQIQAGNVKDLNLIVKADVQGSVEAVRQALEKLTNDDIRVKIIHGGVGAISESDVNLAEVSNAIIIGFNVRPGINVSKLAENSGVDIRMYRVIYNAIEDIQAAMKGMLDPTYKEVVNGHAEIRQVFKISSVGNIAGCYVLDGTITRNSEVRIVRDGVVIHEGKLSSLKRFKDDVREVTQGYECGIMLENFNDIREKDIIESYIMEEIRE